MIMLIITGAAAGMWALYRVACNTYHGIPRSNDDMVFF